jgi:predicted ABC-type ATPase
MQRAFFIGRRLIDDMACFNAIETPILGYLRKIKQWQQLGYEVKLWFLSLPNEDLAVSRVAQRVSQGGHNIPEEVIRRRFHAGIKNFRLRYGPIVDARMYFDNAGMHPELIEWSDT